MTKPKYKISDLEGVELFLKQDQKSTVPKSVPPEQSIRPAGYKIKAILAICFGLLLVGSIFYFKSYITETRASSRQFTLINKQFTRLVAEMNQGGGSTANSVSKKELADSLIMAINVYRYKYPGQTEKYTAIWPTVIVYRYLLEWQDHSYFNLDSQSEVNRLDLVLEQKIAVLDPDLAEILELLYTLHDFYYFKYRYPLPPQTAQEPVREAEVQQLLIKGEKIDRIFTKLAIRLDVNFRSLANLTRIVLNSYYPEVKQWAAFWQEYNRSLNSETDSVASKILVALKLQFPEIRLLNQDQSNMLSEVRNLQWGILEQDFNSIAADSFEQIRELLNYLQKSSGRTLLLKKYSSYALLQKDFREGKLDFCCLAHDKIYKFAENPQAQPLVFRLYRQNPLISYYLYSQSPKQLTVSLDLAALSGKKLRIEGTIYSNLFFETLEYFADRAISINQLFAGIEILPESTVSRQSRVSTDHDFLITSAEKFKKHVQNGLHYQFDESALLINESLSDLIFANRKSLDSVVIAEITAALLQAKGEAKAKFPDFSSWGRFDRELFNRYAQTEKLDQPCPLNLVVLSFEQKQNPDYQLLAARFVQALFNSGFVVISEEYYRKFRGTVLMPPAKILKIHFTPQNNRVLNFQLEASNENQPLYSSTASISLAKRKIDFSRVIESMCSSTGFQGEVVEAGRDLIKIFSPYNQLLTADYRFKIFNYSVQNKNRQTGFVISKKELATGKFTGHSGKMAIIKIDQVGNHKVQIGDYVDILP